MQTQEELQKEYEQQLLEKEQEQLALKKEYELQSLIDKQEQLLLKKEYEQQSGNHGVPITSYSSDNMFSPLDDAYLSGITPATEEEKLNTKISQIQNREEQLASDSPVDKFRLGIQDSTPGKVNDIIVGVQGGSGYQIHKDSWGFKELMDSEKRKNVLNDLAYITGQQLVIFLLYLALVLSVRLLEFSQVVRLLDYSRALVKL